MFGVGAVGLPVSTGLAIFALLSCKTFHCAAVSASLVDVLVRVLLSCTIPASDVVAVAIGSQLTLPAVDQAVNTLPLFVVLVAGT